MKLTGLTPGAGAAINGLLSVAAPEALRRMSLQLQRYCDDLTTLVPAAPRGYALLEQLIECAEAAAPADSAVSNPSDDSDHDYSDWHRLARSLWFNWGDRSPGWAAGAFAPTLWCAGQVLAYSDRSSHFTMAEVGAGTGRLTYEVARHRRDAEFWVGDVSIESLSLAVALHCGSTFDVPRRVNFDASESGIEWFACEAPTPLANTHLDYLPDSLPTGTYDFVVACNALSLYPDPITAIEELASRTRVGGWLLISDLFCWRVETPDARRIRGPKAYVTALERSGFSVEGRLDGLPYIEDWGYERTYEWRSHAMAARRS